MTESMIYWIIRLDAIHSFFLGLQLVATIFAAIGIAATIIAVIIKTVSEQEGSSDNVRSASKICKIALKVWIPAFCIATACSLTRTFTPTTKEMIAIKVIPQIANTDNIEKIKDISKDMLDITADWLKDMRKKSVSKQYK